MVRLPSVQKDAAASRDHAKADVERSDALTKAGVEWTNALTKAGVEWSNAEMDSFGRRATEPLCFSAEKEVLKDSTSNDSVVAMCVGLRRRIRISDELIKQLKQVVREQQGRIEELRQHASAGFGPSHPHGRAELPSYHVQLQMLREVQAEVHRASGTQETLSAKALRLRSNIEAMCIENIELERDNKRLTAMMPGGMSDFEEVRSFFDSWPSPGQKQSKSLSPIAQAVHVLGDIAVLPVIAKSSQDGAEQQPSITRVNAERLNKGSSRAGLSIRQRLAQLTNASLCLVREDTPRGVLACLLNGAMRTLEVGITASVTLFVAEPWLRGMVAQQGDTGTTKLVGPTAFTLPGGKISVHAYQRDSRSSRVTQLPRFTDIDQLPLRSESNMVLVLPVQSCLSGRFFAALQVVIAEPDPLDMVAAKQSASASTERSLSPPGLKRRRALNTDPSVRMVESESTTKNSKCIENLGLLDAHISALTLLAATAAGLLDMRERIEMANIIQGRARTCLDIAADVNRSRNLIEFEQRAKKAMERFFDVSTVRISFFDPEACELLSLGGVKPAPSAVGGSRRIVDRFPMEDGICGMCVRTRKIIHLDRILASPYVSEQADGLPPAGRSSESNMLVGPLFVEVAERPLKPEHLGQSERGERRQNIALPAPAMVRKVLGVVQLVDKKLRTDPISVLMRATSPPAPVDGGGGEVMVKGGGGVAKRKMFDFFSAEDEDFFSMLLRSLSMAAHSAIQVQTRGEHMPLSSLLSG